MIERKMIMNRSLSLYFRALAVAMLSSVVVMPAVAADAVVVQQPDLSRSEARFISDFGGFAGSDGNAQSLYSGLRTGSRITLTAPATGGGTGSSVVQFDPPTSPMGNGNAFISLALAKEQLANYGITNPTPQELQAALTGGTIIPADPTAQPVVLKGILVQRADGMGWGNIAKTSGMNLGKVVSGIRNGKAEVTASGTFSNRGVTTATGAPAQSSSGKANTASTNRGKSSVDAPRGMVSATGTAVGTGFNTRASAQSSGHAGGASAGLVTGNGAGSSMRAGANAQGQAKGLAKY
jgi:hypothetical protein